MVNERLPIVATGKSRGLGGQQPANGSKSVVCVPHADEEDRSAVTDVPYGWGVPAGLEGF